MPKGRRLKFAEGVLRGLNGTDAYKKAGYKAKRGSARRNASRLLTNADISKYIKQRRKEIAAQLQNETLVEAKDVIREAKRIAFFDPRKLFEKNGNLKQITALDDDTAAAIAGCDIEKLFAGRGEDATHIGNVVKLKLSNKNEALEKLFKHLNLYANDSSSTPTTVNINVTISPVV